MQNQGAFVTCQTSDGTILNVMGAGGSRSITTYPSYSDASIGCYMGYGYFATIDITQITIYPPVVLPPINSADSCQVMAHSSLDMDKLALKEEIPLVGIPFSLAYSSYWFQSLIHFPSKNLGLGGWAPDSLVYYDLQTGSLIGGNGSSRPVNWTQSESGGYVASEDARLVYYFDSNGNLLQTRDAFSGIFLQTISYNSNGSLNTITDQFGNQTTFSYSGNQVLITGPFSQTTILTLDNNAFLSSATNPNQETYLTSMSSSGLLQGFTKPSGLQSQITYDANNLVKEDMGAGGDFISLTQSFNQNNNIQSVFASNALGSQTGYFASAGNLHSSSHTINLADGTSNSYISNDVGQNSSLTATGIQNVSTTINDPRFLSMSPYVSSSTTTIINNPMINQLINTAITAPLQNQSDPFSETNITTQTMFQADSNRIFTSVFTPNNLTSILKSPVGRTSTLVLNSNALPSSFQTGNLNVQSFSYYPNGKLQTFKVGSRTNNYSYNSLGQLSQSVDPLNRTTQYQYDLAGRVSEIIRPDKTLIKFGYDPDGNLTSVTPPQRQKHQFPFNSFNLIEDYQPPSLGKTIPVKTIFSYNKDQSLASVQRPDGLLLHYNYDFIKSRLTSIAVPNGSFSYGYSASTGQISSIESPDNITSSISYFGKALSGIQTSNGTFSNQITFNYNPDFSLSSETIQGSDGTQYSIPYGYDNDGLINLSGSESIMLDSVNALLTNTKLDSISESRKSDSYGSLASDIFKFKSTILYNLKIFPRNNAGQITKKTETINGFSNTYSYAYDKLGELTSVHRNGALVSSYKYDGNGNRTLATINGEQFTGVPDAQDRLTQYGNTTYTYSNYGDLTQKSDAGQITQFSYDVFGSLMGVISASAGTIAYQSDGFHRRILKLVNGSIEIQYIYQSVLQIAAVANSSGVITSEFIYGSKPNVPDYMVTSGTTYRIISDDIGSPKLIVNSKTGAIAEAIAYDEFGNILSDTNPGFQPFGFAGCLYDQDTHLCRFGARDYDPYTGRWLSKDPILFNGGSPNLYGYANNDSINFKDPSGLWAITIGLGFGGIFGGGTEGSGGFFLGTTPSGDLDFGIFGSGGGGFGANTGVGIQGSYYPGTTNDISGGSTEVTGGIGPVTGGASFNNSCKLNSYNVGFGYGRTPITTSVSFLQSETYGIWNVINSIRRLNSGF